MTAASLREIVLSINKLGVETHLSLADVDLDFRGKSYADIRKNRNIAQRYGLTVREGRIERDNLQTISDISEKWLKNKTNRSELSILIRKISLEAEPGVRYFFAESELYAFKGIAFHKMKHPAGKEFPVYFAVTRDTLSEDIMNIFKGVGLFGDVA